MGMSVGSLRQLYPELAVDRWAHLQARLRAEAWIHLFEWGVPWRVLDRYMGIVDRSNFRKSCRAAGIEPPWSR